MKWKLEAQTDLMNHEQKMITMKKELHIKAESRDLKALKENCKRYALYEDFHQLVERIEPKF